MIGQMQSSETPHWLSLIPPGMWIAVGMWLLACAFDWRWVFMGPGGACLMIGAFRIEDRRKARKQCASPKP